MGLNSQDSFEVLLAVQAQLNEVTEAVKTISQQPMCKPQQMSLQALRQRQAYLQDLLVRVELALKPGAQS